MILESTIPSTIHHYDGKDGAKGFSRRCIGVTDQRNNSEVQLDEIFL